jgi:hypothetical protein
MSAPIVHRPAGVQPWLDEERTPAFRMPWKLLAIVVLLLSSCCGAGAFGVSFLLSSHARQSEAVAADVTATASPTSTPTMTATATASQTVTPPATGTPSMGEDRSGYDRLYATLVKYRDEAREYPYPSPAQIDLGPTYTLTPTATAPAASGGGGGERIVYVDRPGKDRIVYRDRLVTSPPEIIVRDIVVTAPPQIVYVVVTATPTPTFTPTVTPTVTPTLFINPEWTVEPIPTLDQEPCTPEVCNVIEPPIEAELLPLPPPVFRR